MVRLESLHPQPCIHEGLSIFQEMNPSFAKDLHKGLGPGLCKERLSTNGLSGSWNPSCAYSSNLEALSPSTRDLFLSDFYTETITPVAPSGSSHMLRNLVLKYFFPSLSLPSFLQFLRNLTHFTMVSGRFCDKSTWGWMKVAADAHGSLLK